ncbi:hypothetical protein AB1N83_009069 [Pleurotus pulmonarius]
MTFPATTKWRRLSSLNIATHVAIIPYTTVHYLPKQDSTPDRDRIPEPYKGMSLPMRKCILSTKKFYI